MAGFEPATYGLVPVALPFPVLAATVTRATVPRRFASSPSSRAFSVGSGSAAAFLCEPSATVPLVLLRVPRCFPFRVLPELHGFLYLVKSLILLISHLNTPASFDFSRTALRHLLSTSGNTCQQASIGMNHPAQLLSPLLFIRSRFLRRIASRPPMYVFRSENAAVALYRPLRHSPMVLCRIPRGFLSTLDFVSLFCESCGRIGSRTRLAEVDAADAFNPSASSFRFF